MGNKRCYKCKEIKIVSNFYKNKNKRSGLDSECKQCKSKTSYIYRKTHHKEIERRRKTYLKKHKERTKNRQKIYYEKHKKEILECNKVYREKHKEEITKHHSEYLVKKYNTNNKYRIKSNISSMIRIRLKKRSASKNGKSTFSFLPYTVEELMAHLEKQFKPGMTWENRSAWHIDHKKPDSKFNYTSVEDEEFQRCWALENLQPLWAKENIKKSNRI